MYTRVVKWLLCDFRIYRCKRLQVVATSLARNPRQTNAKNFVFNRKEQNNNPFVLPVRVNNGLQESMFVS